MDLAEFNFEQARRLMLAEPNLVPKVFIMNSRTRNLFKLSGKSNLITVDPESGDGKLVEMYSKKVYSLLMMPDNVIGLFLKSYLEHVVKGQTDWSAQKITDWMQSTSYIKNAPFRISNIGYIEVGVEAYNTMIADPVGLANHKFNESEIY